VSGTLGSAAWWWLLAVLAGQPRPNPALDPAQVIRTVVEALDHPNSPSPNAGIFTVYQFASPGNRVNTGPYGNFLRLVKQPYFAPLLARHSTEYGPLSVSGDRAGQEVSLRMDDGQIARYHFAVSRQTSEQTHGRCAGCWMVDRVSPLPVGN
jgi:Domain of unknown function (DUF4864)